MVASYAKLIRPGRRQGLQDCPPCCRRPRIGGRRISGKLPQLLRSFIVGCACSATAMCKRRDEWLKAGIFARLKTVAREAGFAAVLARMILGPIGTAAIMHWP